MSGRVAGHEPLVDRSYYEEIARLLHGLPIRLDDRLPGKDVTLIAELINANELGLAKSWPMCSWPMCTARRAAAVSRQAG